MVEELVVFPVTLYCDLAAAREKIRVEMKKIRILFMINLNNVMQR